jgi:hypothetical protein
LGEDVWDPLLLLDVETGGVSVLAVCGDRNILRYKMFAESLLPKLPLCMKLLSTARLPDGVPAESERREIVQKEKSNKKFLSMDIIVEK